MTPIERELWSAVIDWVDSKPIEISDYCELRSHAAWAANHWLIAAGTGEEDVPVYGRDIDDLDEWSLYHEVTIESYRIDFIVATSYAWIAVECDGHDAHERTKQQASYDRARDRFFLARHLPTVRFTGSDLVHSPQRCAAELYEICHALDRKEGVLAHAGCFTTGENYRKRVA